MDTDNEMVGVTGPNTVSVLIHAEEDHKVELVNAPAKDVLLHQKLNHVRVMIMLVQLQYGVSGVTSLNARKHAEVDQRVGYDTAPEMIVNPETKSKHKSVILVRVQ